MNLPEASHSPAVKQADGLVSTGASLGRAPAAAAGGACGPLSLAILCHDVIIDAALEDTNVLVEDTEKDDGEEGEDKLEICVDMPGFEDDAGVDDLGVPKHVHCAHGHFLAVVSAVVHGSKSSSCGMRRVVCSYITVIQRLHNIYVQIPRDILHLFLRGPPHWHGDNSWLTIRTLQGGQLALEHLSLHEMTRALLHAFHEGIFIPLEKHKVRRHCQFSRVDWPTRARVSSTQDFAIRFLERRTSNDDACSMPLIRQGPALYCRMNASDSGLADTVEPRMAIIVCEWYPARHLGDVRWRMEVIAVDKGKAQRLGESCTEGGFACA